ncbi:metal-dependent hydrolase [Bacillus sp. JCM 19046]|nr:metal-dependent hydrolase [Bacillus sp. JCM 19045]GAF17994.1 metal-dependent hydrolase [Bacillus sp. JCM 19046]
MIEVDLIDETNTLSKEQLTIVQHLIEHAYKVERLTRVSELSVTFVDEKTIHELNREHRNIDRSTDVLSFALNDGEEDVAFHDDEMPDLLGDIVISVKHIHDQAKDYGHSFERELGFLTIHGFLHLLGYDHQDEEEERQMFTKQEEILESYGLGRSQS